MESKNIEENNNNENGVDINKVYEQLVKIPQKKTEDIKKYRRDYYRIQYHNNNEFREKKKQYYKNKYEGKTIRCANCLKRWKKSDLEEMHYIFDENKYICPDCSPINNIEQIKTNRGRPRKQQQQPEPLIYNSV